MGKHNHLYSVSLSSEIQLLLGRIHLDLEEFAEAQKQLQCFLKAHKMVYGVEHKDTMQAHLGVAMAARLGFPAHGAKKSWSQKRNHC